MVEKFESITGLFRRQPAGVGILQIAAHTMTFVFLLLFGYSVSLLGVVKSRKCTFGLQKKPRHALGRFFPSRRWCLGWPRQYRQLLGFCCLVPATQWPSAGVAPVDQQHSQFLPQSGHPPASIGKEAMVGIVGMLTGRVGKRKNAHNGTPGGTQYPADHQMDENLGPRCRKNRKNC